MRNAVLGPQDRLLLGNMTTYYATNGSANVRFISHKYTLVRFEPKDAKSFSSHTDISLDIDTTAEIVGYLDTVMCVDTLVAFVSAGYTHKQLQMAYER